LLALDAVEGAAGFGVGVSAEVVAAEPRAGLSAVPVQPTRASVVEKNSTARVVKAFS
jgi:hypothetical protein